ncbi:MAG: hypothetical protein JNJ54_23590 [Myxococcaceae bacterium]|nr:hypothetical protein [Myxococcaceae bacterium]
MTAPINNADRPTIDFSNASHSNATAHTRAAGPVCTAESNRLEMDERNFATASLGLGEETIANRTRALGDHQSLELVCKTSMTAEIAAKAEAKLKISKRDDGKYEVETFNAFGVGGGLTEAKGTVGVAAGSKFVVATPEAAADLAQAIASLEVVASTVASPLAPIALVADAYTGTSVSALTRLAHYRGNLTSVRCDVRGAVEGELAHEKTKSFSGTRSEAKLEGQVAKELTIDLERGRATTSVVLEGKAEAEGTLDLSAGGAIMEHVQKRFGGKAEAKVTLRYEERVDVPEALKARVKSGQLSSAQLARELATLPTSRVVVAEVEVEGKVMAMGNATAKAKLAVEIPVEPGKVLDRALAGNLEGLMQPLLDARWEVEGEVGLGVELKVGVEGEGVGASIEGSATHWTGGKRHLGSLRECLEQAAHHFEDAASMHASVDQQRAFANMLG